LGQRKKFLPVEIMASVTPTPRENFLGAAQRLPTVRLPNESSFLEEQQRNAVVEVTKNPVMPGTMGTLLSSTHGLASAERAGVSSRGGAVNQRLQNEGSQVHDEAVVLAQYVALDGDDAGPTSGRGRHAMPRERRGKGQPEGGAGGLPSGRHEKLTEDGELSEQWRRVPPDKITQRKLPSRRRHEQVNDLYGAVRAKKAPDRRHVGRQVMRLPVNDNEELSEDDDNIIGDGSEPSTDDEVDAANWQLPDAYRYRSKASNMELDAYRDKGGPRPTKYLRMVHEKYHQLVSQHVGRRVTVSSRVKPPKVPEPKAYAGEEDVEVFERWLTSLLRWFRINRYGGPDLDEDRVVCTAMFLEGTALTWYNDNVDGGGHQLDRWSFETVVTGLYDRFLHEVALGSASDEFGNAMYIPGEGIMAFYYRLTRYAARMVRSPDRYTFKRHFIMRLPKEVFDYLLSKEVTAEYSSMESILHHARKAEENACQMTRWYNEQCTIKARQKVLEETPDAESDVESGDNGDPLSDELKEPNGDVPEGEKRE
jgi:hypothetical protein